MQTDLNNSLDVLGRLLTLHAQSLPMYLADARPWARASEEDAVQALELVVADQRRTIERIKNQIMDAGGVISHGAFPMQFTGLHDVALEFMLGRLIESQQRMIDAIAQCVEQVRRNPTVKSLAQEALGEAKGHLDSLQEATAELADNHRASS